MGKSKFSLEVSKFSLALQPEALVNMSEPVLFLSPDDVYLTSKLVLILLNSADPGEMQHYAAFHQGLHCLPKYLFRSFDEFILKIKWKIPF